MMFTKEDVISVKKEDAPKGIFLFFGNYSSSGIYSMISIGWSFNNLQILSNVTRSIDGFSALNLWSVLSPNIFSRLIR